MMKRFYRPTWIEIDLTAIKRNIQLIQSTQPNKQIWAVIKANAYGHGDLEVAKIAEQAGVTGFAVSSLDEGLRLRQAGIESPILSLGAIEFEDLGMAAKEKIAVTITQEAMLEKLTLCAFETPLQIHLKLNTGMNRLGFDEITRLAQLLQQLQTNPTVVLSGLFTHFATADEASLKGVETQYQQFETMVQSLALNPLPPIHLSNTAATLRTSFKTDQILRVGLGLYGVYPDHQPWGTGLSPALSLYSRLTHVRWIKAGECVGYGATYQVKKGHWMGVVPIGYADGWWRNHQGRSVLIQGKECPIIGRVCMDQLMVELPERMEVGTRVTLIGEGMPIYRVAKELDTIPYEVLCALSDRIPRVYLEENQQTTYNLMRFS